MISRRELLALGPAACVAQDPQRPLVRATGKLVVAPTTVTDAKGKLIRDLEDSEFLLFDDGLRQNIHIDRETMPLSLVIAAQATNSARKPLARLREAASLFAPLVLGEGGEAALVSIRDRVETVVPLTADADRVVRQLRRLPAKGAGGSLVDAILHGAGILAAAPAGRRKVILVMGEARDRTSESTLDQAMRVIEREQVTVYALTYSPFLMAFAREVIVDPDT